MTRYDEFEEGQNAPGFFDERLEEVQVALQLAERLKALERSVNSIAVEASNLPRPLSALQRWVHHPRFYIGVPLVVGTLGTIASISAPAILGLGALGWVLSVLLAVGIGIVVFLWVANFSNVPPTNKKELCAQIDKVARLFDADVLKLFHSAVTGMTISHFLLREAPSRGEEHPETATAIHSSLNENVLAIQDAAEEEVPIVSFEARMQPPRVRIEEMLTTFLEHAITGHVHHPFLRQRACWQEVQQLFSCSRVALRVPKLAWKDEQEQEKTFDLGALFPIAKANSEEISRVLHLQDKGIFYRSRIALDNEAELRPMLIKVCFWPRWFLLQKAAQCYIEMHEISGIPIFWIEDNSKNRRTLSDVWQGRPRPGGAGLEMPVTEHFVHLSSVEQWDFIVGSKGGYRGYRSRAQRIEASEKDLIYWFQGLFANLMEALGEEIMWAKDAAWIEFAKKNRLCQLVDEARHDLYNKLVRESGFFLCYKADT